MDRGLRGRRGNGCGGALGSVIGAGPYFGRRRAKAGKQHADFARERILVDARGWRDPAESVACLPVLLEALWRGRQVRFIYSRLLGEAGERIGDPLGLVAKGSTWYLIARAEDEPRTYRVSRMREAAILEQAAKPLAGFDLAAYWERSATEFRERLPRYYATFLADRAVMPWVRYRGWRLEEETACGEDGRPVRVRLRFDAEEEAIQFALSFGGRIEVVEPVELRAKVLAGAQAMVGIYR